MNIEDIQKEINKLEGVGKLSDGYHTFDELYRHRAILFSLVCNQNQFIAWKSLLHSNPEDKMYAGMFIVGINTPFGQVTYHYDIDPYWNIFKVQELERAPEWDGHTPDQAAERMEQWTKSIEKKVVSLTKKELIENGEL